MVGEHIGNYRVLSLIGQGGMGSVYMAQHPAIGRRVAIKVLREDAAKRTDFVQRFINEARAANAIRHRNIIEIYDAGVRPDGTVYLIMELLEGEDLGVRLRREDRLASAEAIAIGVQVCSALAATHAKGIIHRDLKPDNLFLVPDDQGGGADLVKVLDFGIAKLHTTKVGPVTGRSNSVMGTPIYMSPEQCRGTRPVDHRTDIYSLGLILYEMLCGAPPFTSESYAELLLSHVSHAPPPIRERNPAVPETLEKVIMRALEKEADDRFETAMQLEGALREVARQAILPPTPIRGDWHTPPPASTTVQVPRVLRLSPGRAAATGAAIGLVVAGLWLLRGGPREMGLVLPRGATAGMTAGPSARTAPASPAPAQPLPAPPLPDVAFAAEATALAEPVAAPAEALAAPPVVALPRRAAARTGSKRRLAEVKDRPKNWKQDPRKL
jgi:serine/threonine-protein kinase